MTANEIKEEIYKTVDIIIAEKFKDLKFNYYVEGTVMQVNSDNTYDVLINNQTNRSMKTIDDKTYKRGDIVMIEVVNNNYSRKYIAYKRPE